jgi:peptidoglycan/xylan/chitin deacetylase (PgdA/CDA1 family)
VYTDYVGTSRNALSWDELKSLVAEGFDVQAHSKTHSDLRRGVGETDAQYARRMQAELADPPRLFQRQLGRGVQFLAYPYGRVDDDLVLRVREQGYAAAFTVRRESNPSFVRPLEINRSQIYAEMTLEQFGKNLNLFHHENLR